MDNLNDYYDPTLKDYRLSEIEKAKPAGIEYEFVKGDLADKALIDGLFEKYHFDGVNLVAQAGVIYMAESAHTDCEPNDNVEALHVLMDQAQIEAMPVWKSMHK